MANHLSTAMNGETVDTPYQLESFAEAPAASEQLQHPRATQHATGVGKNVDLSLADRKLLAEQDYQFPSHNTLVAGRNGYGECIVIHGGYNNWIIVDSAKDPKSKQTIALSYLDELEIPIEQDVKLTYSYTLARRSRFWNRRSGSSLPRSCFCLFSGFKSKTVSCFTRSSE